MRVSYPTCNFAANKIYIFIRISMYRSNLRYNPVIAREIMSESSKEEVLKHTQIG